MVSSPSSYLVSAAVAVVALQIQQAAATSLYYDPFTSADTVDQISSSFPARGADVADQDCAITVQVDPTLPDITTISTVPVEFPDLLANLTTAPTEPVSAKVGTVVLSEQSPATNADQDAYVGKTTSSTPVTMPATKTGVITPLTGAGKKEPKDCTTGWEESKPARKLRDSAVSGRELESNRRLEATPNKDIAKLEAFFGTSMEMNLSKLPTVGVHAPSPWAGPYWPTYQDSINIVWSEDQPSPAEKYATAFGLDVTDFMNKVSKDTGVDSQSSRKKCSSDSDCSTLTDGSSCAIRTGKTSGYCIPTWFGICHAWAPAAILEAEPICPVTHNGVTFQPLDIKALISDVYDGASVGTVFTGTRFNGGTDSTDEYGRHSSNAYRDLNPAYFHIAAANILGKLNTTFVVDVTADSQVWNQPVRGFKVYEQTAMSLEEAAQTFYGLEEYPWNAAAKSIVYVKTRLSWIVETYTDGGLVSSGQIDKFTTGAYYYYLLEMDDDGNIVGGEWVYGSDDDHPDFLWFGKAKPAADTVTSIGLSYADVSMLLEKSVACSASASASGSTSAAASNSASATSSASTSTGSATDVPATSSTASNTGSAATEAPATEAPATETPATETPATEAPATETPVTETPAATTTSAVPTTPDAPVSTTAPASTTAAPSKNQGGKQGNQGHHQSDDNDNQQQQQQEQHPSQKWYQSFFHWW